MSKDYPTKPSECAAEQTFYLEKNPEFVVYYTVRSHDMTFFVMDVLWASQDDVGKPALHFGDDFAQASGDPDDGCSIIAGHLKWDGCMDCNLGRDGEAYREHYCGLEDALITSRAVVAIHALAEEHMEGYEKDLAR
jgi:hypothetical protein